MAGRIAKSPINAAARVIQVSSAKSLTGRKFEMNNTEKPHKNKNVVNIMALPELLNADSIDSSQLLPAF